MNDSTSEAETTTCVDCGATSPPTNTGFTLISDRIGWRLTRAMTPEGKKVLEWRCRECFAKRPKKGS